MSFELHYFFFSFFSFFFSFFTGLERKLAKLSISFQAYLVLINTYILECFLYVIFSLKYYHTLVSVS